MPRMRRAAPHVACAVGLVLIGWAAVRTADTAQADVVVPVRSSTPWTTLLWASVQAPPAGPVVPPVPPVPPESPAERADHPRRAVAALPGLKPVRIDLPSLGVGAPVVPVAVGRDGALGVPEDPRVVGWWSGGGEALVLDGHVDTAVQGPGALFRLVDLASGDAVTLTGADGAPQHFVVTDVRAYPKAKLPPEVFQPASRLVIITCGGHFDRHTLQYVDNIVAFAEPVL